MVGITEGAIQRIFRISKG